MRRRSRAGSKPAKAQRRKTAARKSNIAPKAVRARSSFAARNETKVARLARERDEALEQQRAMADVLKVISRSTFDLQTVLNTLVESAARLCEADFAFIFQRFGDLFHLAAIYGFSGDFIEYQKQNPVPLGRGSLTGRTALERKVVHIHDVLLDAEYTWTTSIELARFRTMLGIPLLREVLPIGVIALLRKTVRPFSDRQIELVTAFANQAVIAIENARLLTELRQRTTDLTESLEQQTATSEVLGVISRSKFELQPILQSVVDTAARLCRAEQAVIFRLEDGIYCFAAGHSVDPAYLEIERQTPIPPGPGTAVGRAAMNRKVARIDDAWTDPHYEKKQEAKLGGIRSIIGVPLMREGEPIGVIALARNRVDPFAEREIELVTTFADQAVIAIENVRLFDEVQKRTQELTESLQQQTATADVLKVISRSAFDLHTVLDTLLQSAARLCEADQGTITHRKGDKFYRSVSYGFPAAFAEYVKDRPVEMGRDTVTGRALLERKVIHIPDVEADPDYTWKEAQRLGAFRTILGVPMLREGIPVGVLALTRSEVRPFTDKQIELVATFADQAAIAIENVRLFEDVQKRTQELSKSLEDLRTAQDRLVQTQKLASLGQLTAGIAHEIKNPLNFVNNFSGVSVELIDELQEALAKAKTDDKTRAEITELTGTLRDNLGKIVQHGKRADSIVKNMLLHSREGSGRAPV